MSAPENTIDILLLGSGGREHALAAKLAESPRCGTLYIAPGNGGTLELGENVALDAEDPAAVADFARQTGCGLVVIGPEAPLVMGVADAVREAGIACFGPGAAGAQLEGSKRFSKELEGSKRFSKELMVRAGIPTAAYGSFTDEESALAYVREQGAPVVVMADGLAAGKGVVVALTLDEALQAVHECFDGAFGAAGSTVVLEEMLTGPECTLLAFTDGKTVSPMATSQQAVHECFDGAFGAAGSTVVLEEMLTGPECTLLAFTDGKTVSPMATSQDHKRALEGDLGPNTGGMGVYSPVPIVTDEEHAEMCRILDETIAAANREGIDFRGCLYGGFMLTPQGPKVIEYNARFGDPETEVLMPRLKSDLRHRGRGCHGERDRLPRRHRGQRGGRARHLRWSRARRYRARRDLRGRT